MSSRVRRVLIPVVIVCGVVLLAFGGWTFLSRRPLPKTRGTVTLAGLREPVEVLRDNYGVPHIYARHAEDLFFAQGYVHAQDRFYQMDFQRRVGSGRLAELFGEKVLETDIFLRTMGFHRIAEQEYRLLEDEARGYMDAYVAGVNAYLQDRKPGQISLEYTLLGLTGTDFEIPEWTPMDSMTWAKMMAWSMSKNFSIERFAVELIRCVGLDGLPDYFAPYREDMPYVLGDEELGLTARAGTVAGSGPPPTTAGRVPTTGDAGTGSNAWVVAGSRTTSGAALLANDTHLGLQMPSIWHEMGMHMVDEEGSPRATAPGVFNMRGFTFPGYPGVIIGHNDRIAWGITDYGDDVQDLCFERINPRDPNQYEVNGSWRDMELIYERIDVQGRREPHVHVVRSTRNGPIITDRGSYKSLESYGFRGQTDGAGAVVTGGATDIPEGLDLLAVSLKWTAFSPGRLWMCFIRLDEARDFREFRQAWSLFNGPILNILYADREGNIGYQVAGHIPIRSASDGQTPVCGWTDTYRWKGLIPYEELPSVYNPQKGYIVSGNNPAAGPNYPYNLGSTCRPGYRARRMIELIEADRDGISMEDAVRIQADTYDQSALETLSSLRGLDLTPPETSEYLRIKEPLDKKAQREWAELQTQVEEMLEPARERLLAWDGHMDAESAEAALYGLFFEALVEETFHDQYPPERWETTQNNSRLQHALYYLFDDAENPWWDDTRSPDVRESRDDILVRAFRRAIRNGIERLGEDMDEWRWGEIHQTEFRNATLGESGISLIENIFNVGPVATSGNTTTLVHGDWDRAEPFKVNHLTTNRWIIDMGELSSGLMNHAPGQSGHAASPHYDDLVETWRKAEYHPSLWTREEVEANRRGKLTLNPPDEAN